MKKLKIVHIATLQRGGAGGAAMRLHEALLAAGADSKFLFLDKGTPSATSVQYRKKIYLFDLMLRILKKLGMPLTLEQKNDYSIRKYKYNFEIFSFAKTAYTELHDHPLIKDCDVVHLHWIANFIDFSTFFNNFKKPIVWTLHDMNPIQGGFHYKEDENRFVASLQAINDEQFNLKKKALHQLPSSLLTVVTPSKWLCNVSRQSEILGRFPHRHIANGIDVTIFTPTANRQAEAGNKQKINVVFVAESLQNYRKGFDIILEILKDTAVTSVCRFTAVGQVKKSAQIPEIDYKGSIDSETEMRDIYNEADIFLLPSREDNLPNTMIESLCCGTPVVGFAIGGLPETITNGFNGFLSDELSVEGIKRALLTCVKAVSSFDRVSIAHVAQAKYSSAKQAAAYSEVYAHYYEEQPAETLALKS